MSRAATKSPKTNPLQPFAVRGVLAGRYRAGRDQGPLLTHYVPGDNQRSVCGKSDETLVDVYGAQPEGEAPTCARCAARWNLDVAADCVRLGVDTTGLVATLEEKIREEEERARQRSAEYEAYLATIEN